MTTLRISATKRVKRRAATRIGRPPGHSSELTRGRILRAARECFARLGYERATNRDIAAAAGVTAAAIYRYFDSKPDLYFAAVREALAELVPRVRAAVTSQASARAAFRALLQTTGEQDVHRKQAARFLSALPLEMQRHPEVAQGMLADPGEVFTIVNELVAAGVRTKEIPPAKRERVVATIIAALMGVAMYSTAVGDVAGEQAVAGFLDLIDDQLFSPKRA
jgi:AcrR family transcriptional regulator